MEKQIKQKPTEQERLFQITQYERSYWDKGELVCGMDEAGRGPLAGPVAVACVIMPPTPLLEHINDSKKLTERRRELLEPKIKETALCYCIELISPEKIDELNILNATRQGFQNAFNNMKTKTQTVLMDYITDVKINANQVPLVGGDALSYSIAAASILAKTTRDSYMIEMDKIYPQYGFAKNKGYGTAEHIAALKEYGACPIHRQSFLKSILAKSATTKLISGKQGEIIAEKFLISKGYEVLERNYHGGKAEIDLIMRDNDTIVFVEVKSRSNSAFGSGLEAINIKKQRNIIDGAMRYCYDNKLMNNRIRFDCVEVDLKAGKVIKHIEAAFILE
jgi:uncharacterized protein (TIGR00252 family)